MNILGKNGIGSILKIILQIAFIGGIVILVLLPIVSIVIKKPLGAFVYILYPNGIAMLVIVKQFIGLFDSLKENKPFCDNTVTKLRVAGISSLVISILFIFQTIYEMFLAKAEIVFVLILGFMFILFFGVAIALYILSELFRQATNYKEENDLTI